MGVGGPEVKNTDIIKRVKWDPLAQNINLFMEIHKYNTFKNYLMSTLKLGLHFHCGLGLLPDLLGPL